MGKYYSQYLNNYIMNQVPRDINIASYRCPFKVNSGKFSEFNTGGLVGGLVSLRNEHKINWFCFDSEGGVNETHNITIHRVPIDKETNRLYYAEFCNNYLWPVFHYMRKVDIFREDPWKAYKKSNIDMAKHIVDNIDREKSILVNDYHLSLVPNELKITGYQKISFFWHIPWVSYEYLQVFPWLKEIINGISGARKIGFHLPHYRENFLNAATFYSNEIQSFETLSRRVISVPLGIEPSTYEKTEVKSNKFDEELKNIKKRGIKIVSSLSRLDYTKGITQKLEAFKNFLLKNPQFYGKVVLVIVVSPSREEVSEYRWYKETIDRSVGNINSQLRTPEWTPIIYIYRKINQSEVLSLYRESDLFLVTPLMDGLNLVAEEYISANENCSLILSKFAGISYYIDSTEKVNPFNVEEFSCAIKNMLEMPMEVRKIRAKEMKETVRKYDIENWLNKMIL